MSFREITMSMDWPDENIEGGTKKVEAMLDRLDASWHSLESTTLAVMLATTACTHDKEAAQKCLGGMLNMLAKMETLSLSATSWQCEPPSRDEMLTMADEVDAAGKAMAENITPLGAAVVVGLLGALPSTWGRHYRLLEETRAGLTKILAEDAASYFSGLLVDEQRKKMANMLEAANKTVLTLNSRPARVAKEWADRASKIYESVVAGGHPGNVALTEVIRREGFPDAAGITGRNSNGNN